LFTMLFSELFRRFDKWAIDPMVHIYTHTIISLFVLLVVMNGERTMNKTPHVWVQRHAVLSSFGSHNTCQTNAGTKKMGRQRMKWAKRQ
jgi:hypothetical protein